MSLLTVDPTTLDSNSIYDMVEHMPFPKLDYIEKETGINLVLGTGSELEALATVRFMTKTLMAIIKDSIISESRPKIEYLIAKSEEHRKAFIDTVCAMIMSARVKGISNMLESGSVNRESLSKVAQAHGSILFTKRYAFYLTQDQIRSDY